MGISRQILQALLLCVVVNLSYQQTTQDEGFFYYQRAEYPKDCNEIKDQCTSPTENLSKVYLIKPEGYEEPFEVYCDQETEDGGWTVIQRRRSDTIDFERNTTLYRDGFGFLNEDHWLGSDKIAYLTNQKKYELRIDLDSDRTTNYAKYAGFRITDEEGNYRLVELGAYDPTGNIGSDPMGGQEGMDFAEKSGCSGVWWFTSAGCSSQGHLNDAYNAIHFGNINNPGFTEMKIRPLP